MPDVYGYTAAETATLLSIAGVLNLFVTIGTGWWMARSGPMSVWLGANILRAGGALGMAILGSTIVDNRWLPAIFMSS